MASTPRAQEATAQKPTELPKRTWLQILKATWKEAGDDNLEIIGAGVAFYAFSAFVPLLTALVLSYGLFADPASVVGHVQALTSVLPQNAAQIIGDQLQTMVQSSGAKTGFALAIAIAVALYGASKGAGAVITALNIAFDVKETRSFVKRTLLALGMTIGAILVLILGIGAVSAVHLVERLLPALGGVMHVVIQIASFLLAAAVVALGLAVVYRYGPNRPDAKWRWISPGSIVATVVWLIATAAFGFYVANFGSYNATYGSLGAVIVFLTWLYLTAYIVLLGAEMNAEIEVRMGRGL